MAESTHVIKPRPPVRAFVIAAVGSVVGAVLLVLGLGQDLPIAVPVAGGIVLASAVALLLGALLSMRRLAVTLTLDDDGYVLKGPGLEHAGQWSDVSKVTQTAEGSHVTIYHGSVRRTHLLFPGGDRQQIADVLNDVRARLDAYRG